MRDDDDGEGDKDEEDDDEDDGSAPNGDGREDINEGGIRHDDDDEDAEGGEEDNRRGALFLWELLTMPIESTAAPARRMSTPES